MVAGDTWNRVPEGASEFHGTFLWPRIVLTFLGLWQEGTVLWHLCVFIRGSIRPSSSNGAGDGRPEGTFLRTELLSGRPRGGVSSGQRVV